MGIFKHGFPLRSRYKQKRLPFFSWVLVLASRIAHPSNLMLVLICARVNNDQRSLVRNRLPKT